MPRWTRRPEGSNWGEFGPDDQIGRLNYITPAKVLVLGAGVVGTTSAYYLAKAGHEVTVVDRQPGAGRTVPAQIDKLFVEQHGIGRVARLAAFDDAYARGHAHSQPTG